MERGLAGPGSRRDCRGRVVVAANRSIAGNLGGVCQWCAAGADRQALRGLQSHRGESQGARRALDLSRSAAARLGASEVARQANARPNPYRLDGDRAVGSDLLERALLPSLLLE